MQFTTALLALVASTASAAVLPRDNQGQWNVEITVGPDVGQIYLHAEFSNDQYTELRNTCVEAQDPYLHGCDQLTFDFTYDGKLVTLQETLPSGVVVYGEAAIEVTTDIGGGRKRDDIVIPVSRAVV
ncbi:hypothetical protein J4E83_000533 [Alternaria metachromatica]|uniref:uncharacterized protein n=1 Tax=Alternaria metachromatica TaxID=283354 RepID=UPI0020C33E4E|nr:uncharacterized protein J4E83_000533 [Alternaria metachromatica]KAI4637716.1 hypothetical protein J4E83_000533 [Alternaria metachromatica]